MKCTVVREKDRLFVRYEMTCWSEPTLAIGYWPIDQSISRAAFRLEGFQVEDRNYSGRFSLAIGPALDRLGNTIEYHQLKDCVAVLVNGAKTEAERIERQPIPCPKVRRGVETRYHEGTWQKLLKRGWVSA